MSNNVIEVILRGVDETKALVEGIEHLKTAVKGFIAYEGIKKLIEVISEGEKATAQLDSAFKATGDTVGLTRKELDELSEEIKRTTVYSGNLVKEAEAVLLTFTNIRGEAFGKTIKVAADLSARMGTDLVSAVRLVGRALEDPSRGMDSLRRAGVVLDAQTRDLIKTLIETGRTADAQTVILEQLEKRFGGTAAAIRNTLGGALAGLKNAFEDLFEGTPEATSPAIDAINQLTEVLSDPALKGAMDSIIAFFADGARLAAEFGGGIKVLAEDFAALIHGAAAGDIPRLEDELDRLRENLKLNGSDTPFGGISIDVDETKRRIKVIEQLLADARKNFSATAPGSGAKSGDGAGGHSVVAPEVVQEFNVTAKKLLDGNGDVLRELDDQTKTGVEKISQEYSQLKANLQTLLDEGIINTDEYNARLNDKLDEILPEIDINKIRSMYDHVKESSTELAEFMKGVWQSVGASFQGMLSDLFYNWKFSWKSIVDVVRRALADILSAILTSKIKDAFVGLMQGSVGKGGFLGWLAGAFGFKAGGGSVSAGRPQWVGEDGKELFVPTSSGKIYNRRQLAGMGGGGSVVYAPNNQFNIIEREDPRKTRESILEQVLKMMQQQQAEMSRLLSRSGVEVRG